jgi:hypothetical protein
MASSTPSCFISIDTLPTGTLIVCIPKLFPPKENHNVGLLRFDDDHDHICYRFAQVQIFGGKSNVFFFYLFKIL